MKSIYIKFIFCSVLLSALSLHSCTLDEYNPGAFTKEALATSIDGYETLINQCYFAMERFYYGAADWMSLTEGDTDLWTYKANESTSYTQWFWFFAGTSPNTTYTNNWWNGTYDGVGACNEAIALGDKPPYTTEEERNAKIAEARFLRACVLFQCSGTIRSSDDAHRTRSDGNTDLLPHPHRSDDYLSGGYSARFKICIRMVTNRHACNDYHPDEESRSRFSG